MTIRVLRALAGVVVVFAASLGAARPVAACSPPFEPTIAKLGPNQMVLLGVTGDRVPSGRVFHVERQWNVDSNTSPIVIAFKEGDPVGDCSYPVAAGQRLIIAPDVEPDGRLSANLATLQADPNSEDGRRYIAEAHALFGEGTVPVETRSPDDVGRAIGLVALAVFGTLAIAAIVVIWRRVGA